MTESRNLNSGPLAIAANPNRTSPDPLVRTNYFWPGNVEYVEGRRVSRTYFYSRGKRADNGYSVKLHMFEKPPRVPRSGYSKGLERPMAGVN